MFWHGGFKKLFDPMYMAGTAVALVVGCSWHTVNWYMFGDEFIRSHLHQISLDRYGSLEGVSLFYLFGYFKDMLKNYWPWLPVAAVGMFLFAKRSFRERDAHSMLLFLWVSIPFLIMSTSRNQTLRYLFMIFPALAMITSYTIAGWLRETHKEKALPWMLGVVMATALVVNVTPAQVKVSLSYNSAEVRDIAPFIRMNTKPGERIFNYRFSPWNPTQAMAFYSDRFLGYPVSDPETLIQKVNEDPRATWLSSVPDFKNLEKDFPGKLYLIYGNRKFAYFTSQENRKNVVYDFSDIDLPVIR
mgnify:FL=1